MKGLDALFDPGEWWGLEDGVATFAKGFDFDFQLFELAFRFG